MSNEKIESYTNQEVMYNKEDSFWCDVVDVRELEEKYKDKCSQLDMAIEGYKFILHECRYAEGTGISMARIEILLEEFLSKLKEV